MARWALILGASSGFGAATARELAKNGFNICGVHLDRPTTMPDVDKVKADIEAAGREALYFNVNAANAEKRAQVLDELVSRLGIEGDSRKGSVEVMMHSLAFGTLKPFIADNPDEAITQQNMDMTLDVMAHSLVYWAQDLIRRNLMLAGGHIFAMTSAGARRVFSTYGAVSAAKAALESHMRQLALELGPRGISVNCIEAGVTDTPALRKIPGNERMANRALELNPGGRLTMPQDIARTIAALSRPDLAWITGDVIRVDGGEAIAS
ncbi:MAG: 3-oxoacyl-ACP reductase [Candidatus Chloroheliales bacterium]|nr:MAG: 3-oxoacyl-ACP reductase [Chloroflexota bacterium]